MLTLFKSPREAQFAPNSLGSNAVEISNRVIISYEHETGLRFINHVVDQLSDDRKITFCFA